MVRDQDQTTVLVTGGAGYVGSHCVLLLLEQNYNVVVIDNCTIKRLDDDGAAVAAVSSSVGLDSNGNLQELPESLRRVEQLAQPRKLDAFYGLDLVADGAAGGDCGNGKASNNNSSSVSSALDELFHRHNIKVVMHFAALKSIPESLTRPLDYYTNNLSGTINLLNAMRRHGCRNLIFSSSATVYGLPQYLPVDESHQVGLNILNPYGRGKCMIEDILRDLCLEPPPSNVAKNSLAHNGSDLPRSWNIISLRYFNPVGAHPSGQLGEHSQGIPNNLMPYVAQVAAGKREKLSVFGADFDTKDGTGVRDYIHIMDLARGHTQALKKLLATSSVPDDCRYRVYNLGTGRGYSVLEVIETFERVNGVRVPYEISSRRQGDAGEVYADASLAREELGWEAKHSLAEMVRDTYNWQTQNPNGFKSKA